MKNFQPKTKRQFSFAILITLAMLGLAWGLQTKYSEAGEARRESAFGSWQFSYDIPRAEDDGSYLVMHDYPRASVADIHAAAAALDQKAAEMAKQGKPFKATIVFVKPISIEEFSAVAGRTGIKPTSNMLRAFDPKANEFMWVGAPPQYAQASTGATLVGQPAPGGKPLDTEGLARFTGGDKGFQIIGVVSADTVINQANYEALRKEPLVFAVDPMRQVLTDAVLKEHPEANPTKITVQSSLLYAALEDTGIAPKPQKPQQPSNK